MQNLPRVFFLRILFKGAFFHHLRLPIDVAVLSSMCGGTAIWPSSLTEVIG